MLSTIVLLVVAAAATVLRHGAAVPPPLSIGSMKKSIELKRIPMKLNYSLPALELEETTPSKFLPKRSEVKREDDMEPLIRGGARNKCITSIRRPARDKGIDARVPSLVGKLLAEMSNKSLPRRLVRRRLTQAVKNFVRETTPCTVDWRWVNLGRKFWPPRIRTGKCTRRRQCGNGGRCQERKGTTTVLRWSCIDENMKTAPHVCMWVSVVIYDVVVDCSCQC